MSVKSIAHPTGIRVSPEDYERMLPEHRELFIHPSEDDDPLHTLISDYDLKADKNTDVFSFLVGIKKPEDIFAEGL